MKIENIKFKAKRIDNNTWVEGYFYSECGNSYIIENRQKESMLNRNVTYKVDPSTVCQFTGLKDRVGMYIFEHDMIHIVGFNYAAEVIWSEGHYAFMVVCDNEHSYCLHSVIKTCKIERICNKFDNKKQRMKEEKFDFSQALKRMRKGKLVKRENGLYPFGIDEEGIFYHYGHHIFNEERMLSEDILATDWEEV